MLSGPKVINTMSAKGKMPWMSSKGSKVEILSFHDPLPGFSVRRIFGPGSD